MTHKGTPSFGWLVTLYGQHGLTTSPVEARDQLRASIAATSERYGARLAVIRDVDARLAATTSVASTTAMLTPFTGLRVEGSVRTGAYARRSVRAGLLLHW